jgi:hypothetical protein
MTRLKSPKYPNYPLTTAIENIRKIYEADRTSPLPREVIAKHLGYSGLSGASDSNIATLGQYGLLERVSKGEMKVSQTAVDILMPESDDQKQRAINQAAVSPPLFSEIRNHFEGHNPSIQALRTYLLRRDFHDRAIEPVVKSFAPTMAMMKKPNETESGGVPYDKPAESDLPEANDGFGGAAVGDFIQWESGGALQFEKPRRVRWVSDDKSHVAVEGSDTGIPMSQVLTQDAPVATKPQSPPPVIPAMPQDVMKEGQRKAVFPVSEGDVTFVFPEGMTLDGIEELEAYLAVFLKKEKRNAKPN